MLTITLCPQNVRDSRIRTYTWAIPINVFLTGIHRKTGDPTKFVRDVLFLKGNVIPDGIRAISLDLYCFDHFHPVPVLVDKVFNDIEHAIIETSNIQHVVVRS